MLTQTYPNIEYCVMDGGSTDNSVDILRSYGDRFHWVSEPDGGQTAAINKGLRRCRGEILAYLNSDDVLLPHAVERIVERFRQHPDVDLVYGDADYIDKEGSATHRYASAEYSFRRLMHDCMICQPAAFWTRRIVERVGLFDESANWAMDYEYWLRIARSGAQIEFLPEVIAQSRLYAETKTKSGRGKIFREVFAVCSKHGGYIHLNYCHGYVDYLVKERKSRLLRRLATTDAQIGRLSHYYCLWRNAGLLGLPRAWLKYRTFLLEDHPKKASDLLHSGLGWRLVRGFRRVHGIAGDGWLLQLVRSRLSVEEVRGAEGRLWFSGTPTRGMDVEVFVDGRKVLYQTLVAGQPATVSFQVPQTCPVDVRLEFSDYAVDRAWRRLSLHLSDSNFLRLRALDEALYHALPYLA